MKIPCQAQNLTRVFHPKRRLRKGKSPDFREQSAVGEILSFWPDVWHFKLAWFRRGRFYMASNIWTVRKVVLLNPMTDSTPHGIGFHISGLRGNNDQIFPPGTVTLNCGDCNWIPPKIPETFRFRNYTKICPNMVYPTNFPIKNKPFM